MVSSRSSRIDELYRSARGLAPGERAAFLARACGGDEALRAELEARLATEIENQSTVVSDEERGVVSRTIGPYRVEEQIGAGGMGEVWAATDTRLRRRVAIKFLPAALTTDPSRVARFRNEARAASALNHPNILTIHELGESEGTQYIVTELVKGRTLRARLAEGPMPLSEALEIATQIASALGAAHDAGVVHRDVKPENVMIRPDGLVKVLDFGLAKLLEAPEVSGTEQVLTREGAVMGTPAYMAPEQLRGEGVDARADVWSLGVLLYEMVSGERPFAARDVSTLVARILRDEPPRVGSIRGDTPPQLEALLVRALQKDRDLRQPSARELLEELRGIEREPRAPALRRRFAPGAVAAVIVAAAILAGGSAILLREREGAPVAAAPREAIDSVAVLPFANLSGAQENEHLSDGMTEELIHALGKIPDLKVVSRTSSFALKGQTGDVREVARKLGVAALVDGSVNKSGNRLRVTAQIVSAKDGYQLWSQVYDRELTDVFAIQEEIARGVAHTLAATIGSSPLVSAPTRDLQAYELYLRGRRAAQRYDEPGALDAAISLYREALARDPALGTAWAGLADAYSMMDHRGGLTTLDPVDTYALARDAAQRALAIDPESAEAFAALGHIQTHLGEFEEAERNLGRAVALSPSSGMSHLWYAILQRALGRDELMVELLRRGREVDPLSNLLLSTGSTSLWAAGEYDLAIDFSRRGIALMPDHPRHYIALGRSLAFAGRAAEADEALAKAASFSKVPVVFPTERALAMAVTGRRSEAVEILLDGEARASSRSVADSAIPLFRAWAAVGDLDRAARALSEAVELNPFYARVNIGLPPHPAFAAMLADPRFRAARQRLGLPDLR